MSTKLELLGFQIILVTLVLSPHVSSDDNVPIPSNKFLVNSWFISNVQAIGSRKDLDPALAAAEAKPPTIIDVSGDGRAQFKTITDALKSIPDKNTARVVVKIAGGNYTEKIILDQGKPFVTFYGDPNNVPNIIFNGDAAKYGTVDSATIIIESDYFMGVNFNVINLTPRPDGRPGAQAVALRTSGDKGAYYNVRAYGFQDTLCDDKGLHFYKDCYFEGTYDFIFGNAKSIYLNTEAHVVAGGTSANVITAHARDNPTDDVGYSFLHCSVTGTGKKSYLGRTWRAYPIVVFAYSEITDVIDPAGWTNTGKTEFTKTAFFGEYKNKGLGAALKDRPAYVKKLTKVEAQPFLSLSYIQGSKWLLPPISL